MDIDEASSTADSVVTEPPTAVKIGCSAMGLQTVCTSEDSNLSEAQLFGDKENHALKSTISNEEPKSFHDKETGTSNIRGDESFIKMMPKQQKMAKILASIKNTGLPLRSENSFDGHQGFFIVVGSQSAGKTAVINRMIGCDALSSTYKLGTR